MIGIAVLSPKGGVGKTTLSHLLALGASGWRNTPAYILHTDDRKPMKVEGRPYAYIDARSPERLATLMESLNESEGYCIIDGGGNRPKVDMWIAESVDIVLIPVTADEEAVELAMTSMERLEKKGVNHARYLLNSVSTNDKKRNYDLDTYFSKLEMNLVAGEIKQVAAVDRLRRSDTANPFPTPPTNVNNLSRSIHRIVDSALKNINMSATA